MRFFSMRWWHWRKQWIWHCLHRTKMWKWNMNQCGGEICMKELLQHQIIFGLLVQIKLRKAASCLKVNYTMYFQPPLWVHFRVLIGQKCWLNIALQVTSHRKYPSAILHGLVIVEHIPSLIGPDHLTIGQTSSVPTWVLIAQNSECCLNIVLHITFHIISTQLNIPISQYCTAPSHQNSISCRKMSKFWHF